MNRILFCLLLVSSSAVTGQTVFKCKDNLGNPVFSQRPCADDPAKIETVDTSRSLKTGSGGSVAEEGEYADMNELRRQCQARASEIASRYAATYGRIAGEIAGLESKITLAKNNLAGATWESGMRQQIAGLVAERATMKAAEVDESAANRERCQSEIDAEELRQSKAREARKDAATEAVKPKLKTKAEEEGTPPVPE